VGGVPVKEPQVRPAPNVPAVDEEGHVPIQEPGDLLADAQPGRRAGIPDAHCGEFLFQSLVRPAYLHPPGGVLPRAARGRLTNHGFQNEARVGVEHQIRWPPALQFIRVGIDADHLHAAGEPRRPSERHAVVQAGTDGQHDVGFGEPCHGAV